MNEDNNNDLIFTRAWRGPECFDGVYYSSSPGGPKSKDIMISKAVMLLIDSISIKKGWNGEKFLEAMDSSYFNTKHYFAYKMYDSEPSAEESTTPKLTVEMDKTLIEALIKAFEKAVANE